MTFAMTESCTRPERPSSKTPLGSIHYLKEWNAVGFRSAFMLHNLDWIGDLDISYDASTFDTDPFEPQPDGANTIYPFWVARPSLNSQPSSINHPRSGYVELPYTLPQDSTMFLFLEEKSNEIWRRKLDWIARKKRHGAPQRSSRLSKLFRCRPQRRGIPSAALPRFPCPPEGSLCRSILASAPKGAC